MTNSMFKLLIRFQIIVLSCFTINVIQAQTDQIAIINPIEPLDSDWETYKLEEQVTGFGTVRIGLVTDHLVKLKNTDYFYVLIPETELSIVEVVIKSQDSKYLAFKLFYNIENVKPGPRQFYFPTKYRKLLLKYNTQELSILAVLKNGKESIHAEHYLVSSWTDDINTEEFVLNINSGTPARLVFARDNLEFADNKCVIIENKTGTNKVAYNQKCIIPREYVKKDVKIILMKCDGDMCYDEIPSDIPLIIK